MFFSNLTIKTRVTSISICTIAIPMILIFAFANFFINYLDQQTINSEHRLLYQMSVVFDNYHMELGNICHDFAINADLKAAVEAKDTRFNPKRYESVMSKLESIIATHTEIMGCYVFCENGNQYKLQRTSASIGDVRNEPWYIAAKHNTNQNMLFAEDLLNSTIDEIPSLTFMRGISDPVGGEFLGVILMTLRSDYLQTIFPASTTVFPSAIMVTDSDLRILYHSNPKYMNKLIADSRFFYRARSQEQGYFVYKAESENIAAFTCTSPSRLFHIVELLPQRSYFAPIRRVQYLVSFLCILCCGIMVILFAYLAYGITTPVRKLTEKLEHFKNPGSTTASIPARGNEFVQLENSYNEMQQRINTLIDSVYTAQIKQREAALNTLQSKINPHFLYNTLEMIAAMAADGRAEDINYATSSLAKILRYSLKFENEFTTVRKEMENVNNYLYIQKMRFGDRFRIISDLPPAVLNHSILKLVIQPLVENSIFHGLEPKLGQGIILISGELSADGSLCISIADNGIGISEKDMKTIQESLQSGINKFEKEPAQDIMRSNRGFALMNIHSRLQLKYGPESGLKIESSPDHGTTVRLIIHQETNSNTQK